MSVDLFNELVLRVLMGMLGVVLVAWWHQWERCRRLERDWSRRKDSWEREKGQLNVYLIESRDREKRLREKLERMDGRYIALRDSLELWLRESGGEGKA